MVRIATEPITDKEKEAKKKEIMTLVDEAFAREPEISELLKKDDFQSISYLLMRYSKEENIDPLWMKKNFLDIKGKNMKDIENWIRERAIQKQKIENIQEKVTDLKFLIDGQYFISD